MSKDKEFTEKTGKEPIAGGYKTSSVMAAGSSRYIRYILFAFFVCIMSYELQKLTSFQGILVIYFLTSSSIPTSNFPSNAWSSTDKPVQHDGPPPENNPKNPINGNGESVKEVDVTPNPSNGLPPAKASGERMNATFVTLARNSDLWEIAKSIRHVEDRFNRKYNYDWVFLNDGEFDDDFKKVTSSLVSGKTHYGLIPKEHWSFPDFIDQEKAARVRQDMANRKIIYGDSISYRHMCRYESGFFFRHELMNKFEYYWRVEPSVEIFCDIDYDPFKFMKENKKKYSFVLSLYEYVDTIPTLWDSVKKFMKKHPEHIAEGNSLKFLSDDNGDTYNHCHFVCLLKNSWYSWLTYN
jgi:alpha 1,2-mannosyltransferase